MKFMTMIQGTGQTGRMVGLPTAALYVPELIPVSLPQGVYAARAIMNGARYVGLLTYAPDPLMNQEVLFEFIPFDTIGFHPSENTEAEIEVVKHVREPMSFDIPEQFVARLEKDIALARMSLHV